MGSPPDPPPPDRQKTRTGARLPETETNLSQWLHDSTLGTSATYRRLCPREQNRSDEGDPDRSYMFVHPICNTPETQIKHLTTILEANHRDRLE